MSAGCVFFVNRYTYTCLSVSFVKTTKQEQSRVSLVAKKDDVGGSMSPKSPSHTPTPYNYNYS